LITVLLITVPSARAATLTVNDVRPRGAVGDDLLSLGEAIRVANGELAAGDLSLAEQAQIAGPAGEDVADTIRFPVGDDPARGFAIAILQPSDALPALTGPGDALEGGERVTIDGSALGAFEFGLTIMADRVRVEGLAIRGFPQAGILVQPPPGGEVSDVT